MPDDIISLQTVVVAARDQVACSLGEEAAILHVGRGVYYGLDPVGARIWNLLQQPRTVGELREAIVTEYEVEPERCQSDLVHLLESLRDEELIEICSVPAS